MTRSRVDVLRDEQVEALARVGMTPHDMWTDPAWLALGERYASGYRPTEQELSLLPDRHAAVLRRRARDAKRLQEPRERIGEDLGCSARAVQGLEWAGLLYLKRLAYPRDRVVGLSGRP